MKVIWTKQAIIKLNEIVKFIADDNKPATAKWLKQISNYTKRLQTFPESGRVVPELNNPQTRDLIFKKYRILYKIGNNVIYIVAIRHSRENLDENDY